MQITVEPADLRNLRELLRIERECFTVEAFTEQQIAKLLRNPNTVSLLARVNGEIGGFIIGLVEDQANATTKTGHVYTIDVAVKHRRKGLGIKLLEEIEKAFMKKGAEISYLEARVDNQAARRLYRNQGYIELESMNDYYSTGFHGLRLRKQLKSRQTSSS